MRDIVVIEVVHIFYEAFLYFWFPEAVEAHFEGVGWVREVYRWSMY